MSVVDRSFDHPLQPAEHASMFLAGGIMGNGYQCGMLWGAALAAGARAYQVLGPGPQAETAALTATQNLVAAFQKRNKHINCSEITDLNFKGATGRRFMVQVLKFFLKGGPITCFSMSASYARTAFNEIDATFSGQSAQSPDTRAPQLPVSCAAQFVRVMGGTAEQATLASGFAGGIGLSGGGCGVLGAAVWRMAMAQEGDSTEAAGITPPWGEALLERFLESSGYEFECTKIVGRRFETVEDHASYVCSGGCAQIINAMADQG